MVNLYSAAKANKNAQEHFTYNSVSQIVQKNAQVSKNS